MSAPAAPFLDLGSFLKFLDSSGRLLRVKAAVDKDTELACIARWAMESTPRDQAYGIVFENIRGFDAPVAVNLFAPHATYAAALGTTTDRLLEHWSNAVARPIVPVEVGDAPVHAVVREGDAADVNVLPIPTWTPGRDAGPYLSAGIVITKDPDAGIQNVATYRIQVHDGRRLGLFFGSHLQHGAMHVARWTQRGEPTPVAIAVGAPPAVNFAAAAKTRYGVDEMTIAGGLAGAPIEVVRGRTVDLLVPARAECVIEGFIAPGNVAVEGPFGEALGYMNDAAPAPVVDVTAVCLREHAIHHGYVQQLPPSDGHIVMEMGILGPLWYYLTHGLRLKGLRDLAIAPGSAGVATLLVQVERERANDAASIGRTIAKLNFGQKFICLFDDDIDLRDPETVNWALSARVDPHRDIQTVDGISTFQLDPSVLARAAADGRTLDAAPYSSSLAIIDATLKRPAPDLSLPTATHMQTALARWHELGLPAIIPRPRLQRLL